MTTVYVLLGETIGFTDYEGDTLLGVYASHEAADVAYVQYCIDHSAYDGYCITPVEIGAAAESRWYGNDSYWKLKLS